MDKLRFLADVNLENSFVNIITSYWYDVSKVSDIDRFMNDVEIVNLCLKEKRIIVTEDKDFGEIIFKNKYPCFGIILIRVVSKSFDSLQRRSKILSELSEFRNEKIIDDFIIINETKYRITEL